MSPSESRSGLPCDLLTRPEDLLVRGRVGIPLGPLRDVDGLLRGRDGLGAPLGVAADRVPRRGHLRRGRRDPRARSARSGLTCEPSPIPTQRGAVVSWR